MPCCACSCSSCCCVACRAAFSSACLPSTCCCCCRHVLLVLLCWQQASAAASVHEATHGARLRQRALASRWLARCSSAAGGTQYNCQLLATLVQHYEVLCTLANAHNPTAWFQICNLMAHPHHSSCRSVSSVQATQSQQTAHATMTKRHTCRQCAVCHAPHEPSDSTVSHRLSHSNTQVRTGGYVASLFR